MLGISGFRSSPGFFFAFIDSLLILIGILLAISIRFLGSDYSGFSSNLWMLRTMLMILIIQVAFYYFDLYDLKIFQNGKKMFILLLESIGVSAVLLSLIYYIIPELTMGRGILAISLVFSLITAFFWRLIYLRLFKERIYKERLLIVGTGELAKKIKQEILENGYRGYKIIGFIDEDSDKIGRTI